MDEARRSELARRLDDVRQRIATATAAARREDRIVLVVVTKTWPTSDIRILHGLGVRDVGENRHQDAAPKVHELADLSLTWHFVGQVQSNKAARIATYADAVHSVDSARVATRLGEGACRHGRTIDCFVQVSLDEQVERPGRGGVGGEGIDAVADAVAECEALRLRGVMGVAPLHGDAQAAYAALARSSKRLQRRHPSATAISAGMSGDFQTAIRAGATHVRVGSAVLGQRTPLR